MLHVAFALVALLAVASAGRAPGISEEHEEQHVLTCHFKDQRDVDDFVALVDTLHLDVWTHHFGVNSPADVRVSHDLSRMITLRFPCDVKVENVAEMLEEEDRVSREHLMKRGELADWHDEYHTLADIHSYFAGLAATYPHIATFIPSIGESHEGNAIPVLRLKGAETPERAVFFTGCIHAREWISPAVMQYIAAQLVENYGSDNDTTTILDKFEVVIAPCINPDGYNFSWSDDRLWRKNRRDVADNGGNCYGVDLNRNFDNHWGGVGASDKPCADDYHGPSAASEPETQAVQNFVLSLKRRTAAIDFHAYGQLILRNFGYTREPSDNEAVLKEVGDTLVDVIAGVHGAVYTSQRAAELYPTTGSTDDWFTENAGIWGWTIELRDLGRYGFRLPADQIRPTGEEIWVALKYFLGEVETNAPIVNP